MQSESRSGETRTRFANNLPINNNSAVTKLRSDRNVMGHSNTNCMGTSSLTFTEGKG